MLKPSMIRGKTFETVKNGYDPDAVNSFLAEMADSVSELITENADNEEKIIKLVEKINEYRADEDAIRIALVSAQKESARVISEAQAKSEEMIDSAKTEQVRIAEQSASECERIIKEHIVEGKLIEDFLYTNPASNKKIRSQDNWSKKPVRYQACYQKSVF